MGHSRTIGLFVIIIALIVPTCPSQAQSEADVAHKLQAAFIQASEKIKPCVVNIRVISTPPSGRADSLRDFFGEDPFPFPRPPSPRGPDPTSSSGSGIIIRSDGYILTNNHVVRNAKLIRVVFALDSDTPEIVPAKLVGSDPETDIAIVKVNKNNLQAASLGDSDSVKVGSWAIAVGSPLNQSGSVTIGVVSAKGRHIVNEGDRSLHEYIQTDAAINPGNSGGPLCDMDGSVIGINTVILTTTGFNNGIGFAITANTVKDVLPFLMKGQAVPRGFLGVRFRPVDTDVAFALGIERGMVVSDFPDESPAHAAGLKRGDIITDLNGSRVGTSEEFRHDIVKLGPGGIAHLKVLREADGDMKPVEVKITLAQRPKRDEEERATNPSSTDDEVTTYGLKLENITADNIKKVKGPSDVKRGVLVMEVDTYTLAFEAGIRPGTVIQKVKVNQNPWQEVTSPQEFEKIVGKPKAGDRVLLYGQFRDDSSDPPFVTDFRALVVPTPIK